MNEPSKLIDSATRNPCWNSVYSAIDTKTHTLTWNITSSSARHRITLYSSIIKEIEDE